MYFLLKIAELIFKHIPRKAGYSFFEALALLAYRFSKKRKFNLKKNLGMVLSGRDVPNPC